MESGRFDLAAQQRWLFAAGTAPESTCTLSVEEGLVDLASLRGALVALIATHEILRTRFEIPAGMLVPLQVVDSEAPLGWGSDRPTGAALHCEVTQRDGVIMLELRASAAIADAATLRVLGTDAIRAASGHFGTVDEAPLQYADYAGWQQEKQSEMGAANLAAAAYWRSQQFDAAVADPSLDDYSIVLNGAAVTALSAAQNISIRAAWLALSTIIASRVSGESCVSAAIHVDGRQDPELDGALGAYLTPLPARFDDVQSSSVGGVCVAAAAALQQAMVHALLPPESFPKALLGFSFATVGEIDDAITICAVRDGVIPSVYQVAFEVLGGDEVRCTITGRGNDASVRAASFAQHLSGLIDALITTAVDDRSELPAATVSIWSKDARVASLRRGVADDIVAAQPCSILEAVRVHAQRQPNAAAVVGIDRSYRYGELWKRAESIAAAIAEIGHSAPSPIGILLDRTAEIVPAILGAWLAGSPYMPLHLDHPLERITLQLATGASTVVVTSSELVTKLPPGTKCVIVDDITDSTSESRLGTEAQFSDDALAYVVFTSGSTGVPKGVAVTQSNIIGYASAARERLMPDGIPINSAMVTSFTTDLGNTSLLLSLLSGGCVSVVPFDVAVDGHRYSEWNSAHRVDLLKVTPSHLRALLAAGAGVLPRKILVIGGEALSWELVRAVEALSDCAISNHYGPTETTVGALTMSVVRGVQHPTSVTVPIGLPLPGYQAYVLGANGDPVPDGVAGELCIGGAGVSQGYLGREDFTAERFVDDPWGATMYRTGDSVRRHSDDTIEFLGRIDGQVKIRGYRVEPGEIESVLEQHAQVQQAAVVALEEPTGDVRLVAYVTGAIAGTDSTDELRAHLADTLPPHMIPALIFPLDAMPLTANGKLDRAALPDPATARSGLDAAYVAPRDEVEQLVADIWRELLAVERVGATDDFFSLGGHSLLAAQVVARILRDFGVHLGLHSLFVAPTVEALAILVTDAQIEASGGEEAFEAMLNELEGLSDDEVEALLNGDSNGSD